MVLADGKTCSEAWPVADPAARMGSDEHAVMVATARKASEKPAVRLRGFTVYS
ncbi:hypothetical protein AB0B89_09610 [Sphaerisporangium sp. NPDC049002]|uniref:hypothetical protein n=1 Tax=unclassified Sphaerisporangium TaxID=2630420 RepID=UPI0033EBBCFB